MNPVRNHSLTRVWVAPWWVRAAWNSATTIAALGLAVFEYFDTRLDPKKYHWLHALATQVWVAVAVLLIVGLDAGRRAVADVRRHGAEDLRLELRKQLGVAIATTAQLIGVQAGELGAGLFLKQHHPKRPRLRLRRVERLRLLSDIAESGIEFVPGKGTVGRCWESRNPEHQNWVAINARYVADAPDENRWSDMRSDTRNGLDRHDFCRLLGRYAEVLAVPVMLDGEPIGVLAVDLTWDAEGEQSGRQLDQKEVKKALALIAAGFASALR